MHIFFFKSSISQKSSETNLCVFKEVCFHSVYKGVKKDVLEWESRAWTFSPFLFSPSLSSFTIRKTKERELFPVCIWLYKHQKHTVVKHIFITASFFLHLPPQLEEDDGRVTRLCPVRIAQKPGWLPSNCSSSHTLLGCFWVSVCHPKDPAISVCVSVWFMKMSPKHHLYKSFVHQILLCLVVSLCFSCWFQTGIIKHCLHSQSVFSVRSNGGWIHT